MRVRVRVRAGARECTTCYFFYLSGLTSVVTPWFGSLSKYAMVRFSRWRAKRVQKLFGLPRPLPVTLAVQTEHLEATLGLYKRLEISKELLRECVTVPGCCCCLSLMYNHLMDSCSYVRKNTLLAAKGGAFAPPLPPLNLPLVMASMGRSLK